MSEIKVETLMSREALEKEYVRLRKDVEDLKEVKGVLIRQLHRVYKEGIETCTKCECGEPVAILQTMEGYNLKDIRNCVGVCPSCKIQYRLVAEVVRESPVVVRTAGWQCPYDHYELPLPAHCEIHTNCALCLDDFARESPDREVRDDM